MQSDFEKNAAQSAVDAVERRWQHDQKLQRKLKRRDSFRKVIHIALLAGLIVVGLLVLNHFGKINLGFKFDISDWLGKAERESGSVGKVSGGTYFYEIKAFVEAEVALVKDMPAAVKPKNVAPGFAYYVLCKSDRKSFDMYKLVVHGNGNFTVYACSPWSEPRKIEYAEFKKVSGKRPYLLLAERKAYLCGSKDLNVAKKILDELRSLAR